ncbi:hypothetical protein FAES_3779 [Fibrella aestuarina BUZ 2]|uniref:Oxidoreductase molybdopterin-binding domain-containing protein n=1 Tax=Fibrella aestuarina BUZ 2 TaxID=1166018 RepID=I0KCD3_9BACT|nr:molybdopterin-dependent oxidoreductase [Fibrella aestuarina]CCH01786.1 hypothetical protein FAES_3779 [Fibrella aestuarina BUZ 2]
MTTDQPVPNPPADDQTVEQQARRRTIKAFVGLGLAALVPVSVWRWVRSQPTRGGAPQPLLEAHKANAKVFKGLIGPGRLAPTFPLDMAAKPARVNGGIGLTPAMPTDWQLRLERSPTDSQVLTMDDIRALPKHEEVIEFKCVEGWSQIQHWGGVRLVDVLDRYGAGARTGKPVSKTDPADRYGYVGMETPSRGYYVGIDMASALHPQTLLAYELNGEPISANHGAPLRLLIPIKYGIKNLKCIGRIFFADQPPRDFWAEQGYDYFSGL